MFLIIERAPGDQVYGDCFGIRISDPKQAIEFICRFCERNNISIDKRSIDISKLEAKYLGFHSNRKQGGKK